ncbi:SapC family protein [Oceanospirillum maris]|uniref:SapC family protein n=1 Tax=Oceanospirillum maris TaxID=64977 RepID=UPI000413B2B1|nr:SapC family protein [Oceanospirillum maris]
MSSFVPLSHSTHKSAGWNLISSYSFASGDALAPVSFAEISQLLPRYTTAFYRANPSDPLQLVAIQGLVPGQNLFVTSRGQWLGGYVPAVYRGYPFRMLPVQESDKLALCIDEDSPNFKAQLDEESQTLFSAEGELSELASRVKDFLMAQHHERAKTESLISLLDEYGVIQPWHIKIDGLPESIEPHSGLYHISETKLKDLTAEQVQVLNLRGALGLAYAQLLSEHRMQELSRLFDLHARHAQENADASDLDLEKVFGDAEDDLFRF